MNRKKAIIISTSVSFLVMTGLFSYVYFQENRVNQLNDANSIGTKAENNLELEKSVVVNNNENSSDNFFYIQDLKNAEEIKKAFNEYINKESDRQLSWNRIANEDKKNVPLDDFSDAMEMKLDEKVANLLAKDEYYLVSCLPIGGERSYGIVMRIKLFNNYANLYADEINFMKNWEKTTLKDLHNILFPKTKFSQGELNEEFNFEGELNLNQYRLAKVNNSSDICYNIVDDYLIITGSKLCTDKTSKGFIGE
jgi:hypothetical protein